MQEVTKEIIRNCLLISLIINRVVSSLRPWWMIKITLICSELAPLSIHTSECNKGRNISTALAWMHRWQAHKLPTHLIHQSYNLVDYLVVLAIWIFRSLCLLKLLLLFSCLARAPCRPHVFPKLRNRSRCFFLNPRCNLLLEECKADWALRQSRDWSWLNLIHSISNLFLLW